MNAAPIVEELNRSQVLDSLLDIIDVEDDDDGEDDHDIGFREFARVMTAADVFKMKALAPRPTATHLDEREQARQEALQYLRPGVLVSAAGLERGRNYASVL